MGREWPPPPPARCPWATPLPRPKPRPERAPKAALALGIGLLAAVAYAAFADGAIKVTDGSDVQIGLAVLGIGTLAALAAGWGLHARSRAGGWLGVGLLAAFGAWCALSISWSIAPDESWIEANRAWGYALATGLALVLGASLARAPEKAALAFTRPGHRGGRLRAGRQGGAVAARSRRRDLASALPGGLLERAGPVLRAGGAAGAAPGRRRAQAAT